MSGGIPQDDLTHLEIAEGSRARLTATLKDDTDTVIALANLDDLELTLYVESNGALIPSRTAGQDIKNANGGTVHATSGLVTLLLTPADNVIVDPDSIAPPTEVHVAQIKFTYNGVSDDVGYHLIRFAVANLLKVT